MAMHLEEKKAVVAEIAEVAAMAYSAIAAEYRGLSVSAMTALRVAARNENIYLRVVRNTLAKRAVEGTDFACMQSGMTGPLVFGFSTEDPSAVARVMASFAKEHDRLTIKMISLGGKLLPPTEIEKLANMPTRDQAIAMLMGTMKAPIDKFVRTLVAPTSKMICMLVAIRNAK